ncbi:hypothetical protein [Dongia sp.]|uniref:hypothetical protein n=1 Tax=Dongia sp. TaxID=1977262 RepID=UPI0035AF543E
MVPAMHQAEVKGHWIAIEMTFARGDDGLMTTRAGKVAAGDFTVFDFEREALGEADRLSRKHPGRIFMVRRMAAYVHNPGR